MRNYGEVLFERMGRAGKERSSPSREKWIGGGGKGRREGSVRLIRLPIHTSLSPVRLSERNLEISFRALFCGKSGCGRYFSGLGVGRCETCRSVASSPSSPFSFLSLRPTDQPFLMRKVFVLALVGCRARMGEEKREGDFGRRGGPRAHTPSRDDSNEI